MVSNHQGLSSGRPSQTSSVNSMRSHTCLRDPRLWCVRSKSKSSGTFKCRHQRLSARRWTPEEETRWCIQVFSKPLLMMFNQTLKLRVEMNLCDLRPRFSPRYLAIKRFSANCHMRSCLILGSWKTRERYLARFSAAGRAATSSPMIKNMTTVNMRVPCNDIEEGLDFPAPFPPRMVIKSPFSNGKIDMVQGWFFRYQNHY